MDGTLKTNKNIRIRKIDDDDSAFLSLLIKDEGWNQTIDDWRILKNDGLNYNLIALLGETPVGTASAMIYSGNKGK